MTFASPWYLALLLPLLHPRLWARRMTGSLTYSDTAAPGAAPPSRWARIHWLPRALRLGILLLLVAALARPQIAGGVLPFWQKGVDLILILDISGSMRAEDLTPSRVTAAKKVAEDFIAGRPADRIGLVAFAGEAYTQCPLTLDHSMLSGILANLDVGSIAEDGTAIGMALAEAAARLKDSSASSKVIILLTDGVNNKGALDPRTAAQVVKAVGIRVYTIGIGSREGGRVPVGRNFLGQMVYSRDIMELDEALLREIAGDTGGKFYLAGDTGKLRSVFAEIDQLEKTPFKGSLPRTHTDAYMVLLAPAFALLCLEILLATTRLRRFP